MQRDKTAACNQHSSARWRARTPSIQLPPSILINPIPQGVAHRDFKLDNVCRDASGKVTLIDCGMLHTTKVLQPRWEAGYPEALEILMSEPAPEGTLQYKSPERLHCEDGQPWPEDLPPLEGGELHHRTSPAGDVFLVGVMLYEAAAGRRPFDPPLSRERSYSEERRLVAENIMRTTEVPFAVFWPRSFKELLAGMLQRDPRQRWTAEMCLQGAWLREGARRRHDAAFDARVRERRAAWEAGWDGVAEEELGPAPPAVEYLSSDDEDWDEEEGEEGGEGKELEGEGEELEEAGLSGELVV
jgi:serine/threonine protein kinase